MIIFQTAGGSDLASFRFDTSLLGAPAPATTFRNNAYIHRLNRTLQAEMRTLSAYGSLIEQCAWTVCAETLAGQHEDNHRKAGRELVRLVIANRGIPEDRSMLSFGLTRTLIQVCASMPGRLFERVTFGTLTSLERQLVTSYRKLINEAPLRDVPVLEDLLGRTERQCSTLAESRARSSLSNV